MKQHLTETPWPVCTPACILAVVSILLHAVCHGLLRMDLKYTECIRQIQTLPPSGRKENTFSVIFIYLIFIYLIKCI